MKFDLAACLDVQGARSLCEEKQVFWLQAAGWSVHSSPFARLRSGDCWEDEAGKLWPQPEAVVQVAQAEALRQLEALGWRLEGAAPPGRSPRVVRPAAPPPQDAEATAGVAFSSWSSAEQPLSLAEALRLEQVDWVEVVSTGSETRSSTQS